MNVQAGETQLVRTLDLPDATADYFLPERLSWLDGDASGELSATSRPMEVVGVNAEGRLLVRRDNDNTTYIIDAWLVEPVTP